MSIAPFVPAGTIAAFATTAPSKEFNVETNGRDDPVGHADKYDNIPSGTTVTFTEYAAAVEGMLQALAGIANERVSRGPIFGPPKEPASLRVSATLHGVTE